MKWTDAEDIGIALVEKFPGVDPLTVRFTDLRETRARARRLRRRSEGVERAEARGDPDGVVRGVQGQPQSGDVIGLVASGHAFRPGMRGYFVPLVAGIALAVSAFLPWVIVGDVRRSPACPTSPALWIAGLGALAAVLALLSLITRRNSRHPLLVVGLVALGIMFLSWRIMPRTAGERALTVSQAFAIVEGTPMGAAPNAARRQSASTSDWSPRRCWCVFGLTIVVKRAAQPYACQPDDDVPTSDAQMRILIVAATDGVAPIVAP